jgi:hypothetical protein
VLLALALGMRSSPSRCIGIFQGSATFLGGIPKDLNPRYLEVRPIIAPLVSPLLIVRRLRAALLLAATACWLRPTNGLLWLALYLQIVGPVARNHWYQSLTLTREAIICG